MGSIQVGADNQSVAPVTKNNQIDLTNGVAFATPFPI
jgi:hypothetical protein